MTLIKFKKLYPDAVIPQYADDEAAGFDICSIENVDLFPGQTVLIKTGLAYSLPKGFEIQIRPRSGMSLKTQYIIKNSPGTGDSNYRKELGIIVHCLQPGIYTFEDMKPENLYVKIKAGDRIAQGVVKRASQAKIIEVDELDETYRGGFGSTGTAAFKEKK